MDGWISLFGLVFSLSGIADSQASSSNYRRYLRVLKYFLLIIIIFKLKGVMRCLQTKARHFRETFVCITPFSFNVGIIIINIGHVNARDN